MKNILQKWISLHTFRITICVSSVLSEIKIVSFLSKYQIYYKHARKLSSINHILFPLFEPCKSQWLPSFETIFNYLTGTLPGREVNLRDKTIILSTRILGIAFLKLLEAEQRNAKRIKQDTMGNIYCIYKIVYINIKVTWNLLNKWTLN